MYSIIKTSILQGISTIPISVEIDISDGMPMFDMVGYLSSEVREAKERVRTALHNCGIILPPKRITINLSPGNVRKSGTAFDLPIAVALMCAMGILDEKECEDILFAGELSLNGRLIGVSGILPIVSDGVERGIKKFIIPRANLEEANLVIGATNYGFQTLEDMILFFSEGIYQGEGINIEEMPLEHSGVDFSEVNGQLFLKRACEIAASGMHNLLMVGPPGAGKTMVSERVATILPPMTEEERLELSKIYSVAGALQKKEGLITARPFRNPHHTITRAALIGGGSNPMPGEISLAHHGVLFLDELTEFPKDTLDLLRQPMEDKEIHLSRANQSVTYPSSFLLLAAMNPCSCGYYPDMQRCRCTRRSLQRYFERISQPLLDRIDLCVEAETLSYQELTGTEENENSDTIRKRVLACHQLQCERYKEEAFFHNGQIPAARMEEYCYLGTQEKNYMENVFHKLDLTGRSYHKILRVARTIADMEESKEIRVKHLMEAVCYRSISEKYWGGFS